MYFGIGIYHPKYECNQGTLWRSALSLGANFMFTIGNRFKRQASDTCKSWQQLPMMEFDSIESLHKHLPYSCMLVGVEMDEAAVDLRSFHHPDRCVYLLGAEDHGLPDKVLSWCHKIVQIPSKFCLNVSAAGTVIMYDRISKTRSP